MTDFNRWLHRYAWLVAVCTLILIYAGGLVTTTGSGLAVPDWPLSFGQVFPEMVGGVLYEHGHRLIAASVGILTIILTLWLWKTEQRHWMRRLGGIALLVVIAQGILGGITVLLQLPTAVSVSHAGLAQLFFCLTVTIVFFTSRTGQEARPVLADSGTPTLRRLSIVTTAVIYVQILIGALMRHTASGLAIPDFPLAYGRIIPPFFTWQIAIHFAHRVGALLVLGLIVLLVGRVVRSHGGRRLLTGPAWTLLAAVSVQILLGAWTIWSSRLTVPTTLHVAGGAFTLAASLWLTLALHRTLLAPARHQVVEGARAPAALE